ncbi:MAG: TatD family hydrolase [Marinifilaceae bacterium]|jgi:TatD DNase family protein|nr:TatD family hydrolase [Marinifilaceae bacterium]
MSLFDLHTHNTNSKNSIIDLDINNIHMFNREAYFSLSAHPNKLLNKTELDIFRKEISSKNYTAIGEAGLDKYSKIKLTDQIDQFEKIIEISETYNKALIIHCVGKFNEIINIKKSLKPKQTWIIHGFRKKSQLANQLISENIKLSFGDYLTYDKKIQDIVQNIDLSNFFLETDDKSIDIKDIYLKCSELKENINIAKLNKIFTNSFLNNTNFNSPSK